MVSSTPVRRRISRACDQCNQLRTKCDGRSPCAHCSEYGLTCEYIRVQRKRGKASRKEVAVEQPTGNAHNRSVSDSGAGGNVKRQEEQAHQPPSLPELHAGPAQVLLSMQASQSNVQLPDLSIQRSMHYAKSTQEAPQPAALNAGTGLDNINRLDQIQNHGGVGVGTSVNSNPNSNSLPSFDNFRSMSSNSEFLTNFGGPGPRSTASGDSGGAYNTAGFRESPAPQGGTVTTMGFEADTMRPMPNYFPSPPAMNSPGWFVPSPSAALYTTNRGITPPQPVRYPVLQPLLPHLGNLIPTNLACELLDVYFQSTSSAYMQPQSPYVVGFVFRKKSLLRQSNPRMCSPALLASMLWIGAQTCESPFFRSPSARSKICSRLWELTISLLKPLVHDASGANEPAVTFMNNPFANGASFGAFGLNFETEDPAATASADLDNVITYMHIATVISATEYKSASLRFWNTAWSMARELRLGTEVPTSNIAPSIDRYLNGTVDEAGMATQSLAINPITGNPIRQFTEEEREERRRVWWLLYTMDRHLALCYNKPLFFHDSECDGLLQPIEEEIWQAGDTFSIPSGFCSDPSSRYFRHPGPSIELAGPSIFGYFTPLMTLLGEIVDLVHARNHPRFGAFLNGAGWDNSTAEISQHLAVFEQSLRDFEARSAASIKDAAAPTDSTATNGSGQPSQSVPLAHDAGTPSANSVSSSATRYNETSLRTKIIIAYSTYLIHTMHVLLSGKWDPIDMLDDNDLFISSPTFLAATGHAVSAAEALNDVLEYDPDLSFMPFFFGIYLLQGSFLLLLIADKLQGEASESVVKACETIVRAHEACVVTLNTEYQRSFRKVMRSALAQVRGRLSEENKGEHQAKRREVLSHYRWVKGGGGLAV
ncbi:hypothetical protein P152DRAFT_467847 [Eremomyces bilateralis CBS 781.70]|uniref:Zn(2)-C6 fungal-type domain-containing protein n=1 Tax=Eremomyces bilateralis CBS 781.70 TaxID=1392243 RepID=A0A6G1FXF3_9PEZI|nr:uncharacterized protein P152DRAFT_467847 [Eremomyces bilateralis CBS 781.70]KAF1810428.1 hypothetical protein P152DRAFT_467847 [Eremomyces bilateralis CBS 781.70]